MILYILTGIDHVLDVPRGIRSHLGCPTQDLFPKYMVVSDRQGDILGDTETYRETDRQTGRRTDRETVCVYI